MPAEWNEKVNCLELFVELTLIWVGFLGVCFEVGVGEGVKLPPALSKSW